MILRSNMIAAFLASSLLALAACGGDAGDTATAAETTASETPKIEKNQSEAPAGALDTAAESAPQNGPGTEDMFLGNPDAKVTIIEYASLTCPGCAYFHSNFYPKLKEDYIDTDKIKFVYREFPTGPIRPSYAGSILARCAGGKKGMPAYFAMNEILFSNQRKWATDALFVEELPKYAAQAGIDRDAFLACMDRQDLLTAINANVEEGRTKYDVSSTPSVFLNGERMTYKNYDEMKAQIEAALASE